jgi:hypothetical protein
VRSTVAFASAIGSPVEATLQAFTDSTTNVWGATITGGGANHVLGLLRRHQLDSDGKMNFRPLIPAHLLGILKPRPALVGNMVSGAVMQFSPCIQRRRPQGRFP